MLGNHFGKIRIIQNHKILGAQNPPRIISGHGWGQVKVVMKFTAHVPTPACPHVLLLYFQHASGLIHFSLKPQKKTPEGVLSGFEPSTSTNHFNLKQKHLFCWAFQSWDLKTPFTYLYFVGVVERFLQHKIWAFLGPKTGLLQLSYSYGSWLPSLKLIDSLPLKDRQANPQEEAKSSSKDWFSGAFNGC